MNVAGALYPLPFVVAVLLEKELFLRRSLPSVACNPECGVVVIEGKAGVEQDIVKSVVFRESLDLFSRILVRLPVFLRKYKLKAFPDLPFKLFAGLGLQFHLLELFWRYELAGLFVPRKAALLVFFPGTAWTRGISTGFGRSEGAGHGGLAPRSLVGAYHFFELSSADAVFHTNQVGIAPLDDFMHWLEGI